MYVIQHCFICRLYDSTVSEDAGIEPGTVATTALAIRSSNHTARSHPYRTLFRCSEAAILILPKLTETRLWSWNIIPEAASDINIYIYSDFVLHLQRDTGENRPMTERDSLKMSCFLPDIHCRLHSWCCMGDGRGVSLLSTDLPSSSPSFYWS